MDSARFWYLNSPEETVDGIEAISKVSFATVPMGDRGIGVAIHTGFLYRSEMTVADFLNLHRQMAGSLLFSNDSTICAKRDGRKGTLLYETGRNEASVCYFERFAQGVTCGSTGPIMGQASLFAYCRWRHPNINLNEDDSVAYVSFRGLPHEVPVPAKLLQLASISTDGKCPMRYCARQQRGA